MKRLIIASFCVAAFAAIAVASAAPPPPVVASPGPTPFASCTADNSAAQISAGSVLYPNSEIEPRSAINPANALNIVGEY